MKNKLKKIKDKLIKSPAENKKAVFEGLIKETLFCEDLSEETGADDNYLYRINDDFFRSMNYLNKIYYENYEKNLPKDKELGESEKKQIKMTLRDTLLKRDLALIDILESRLHLEKEAVRVMENAVINSIIQYYLMKEMQNYSIEPMETEIAVEEVEANRKRIVSEYNKIAEIKGLSKIAPENEDNFIKQQLINEKQMVFQRKINDLKNEIYDKLIKKHRIEEAPGFWD